MIEKKISVSREGRGRRGAVWGMYGGEGWRYGGLPGRVFIRAREKGVADGKFVQQIRGDRVEMVRTSGRYVCH